MTNLAESIESTKLGFATVLASSVHDMKNSLGMLLCTLDDISQTCGPNDCASKSRFTQLQYEGQRVNNHLIQLLAVSEGVRRRSSEMMAWQMQ